MRCHDCGADARELTVVARWDHDADPHKEYAEICRPCYERAEAAYVAERRSHGAKLAPRPFRAALVERGDPVLN